MEANNFKGALSDTKHALEKVNLQKNYQKISAEVKDTLSRLCEELNKLVGNESIHISDSSYSNNVEKTDL